MTSNVRNFVLFNTDLFVFHQPDNDIDQWFVGGDCAGWFYARLLPVDGILPFREPVMEDWGWTFALAVNQVRVWVNLWAFYPIENGWLFGFEAKKRLWRRESPEMLQSAKTTVCDAMDDIMAHDARISKFQWFAENPFDLGVQE